MQRLSVPQVPLCGTADVQMNDPSAEKSSKMMTVLEARGRSDYSSACVASYRDFSSSTVCVSSSFSKWFCFDALAKESDDVRGDRRIRLDL